MRRFFRMLAAALVLGATLMPVTAYAGDVYKVALQISDNDKAKMNTVLNVAANLSRYYSEKGEEVQIEIVAFSAGLHMLRADTSPVPERLESFGKSMSNVTFDACKNTLNGMTRKEGKAPPLLPVAQVVPSGVVRLIELGSQGWTIIRP